MKLIFIKINDFEYKQKYIEDSEAIPEGWIANSNELNLKQIPNELDVIKLENTQLKENQEVIMAALADLAETSSAHDEGIAELAGMVSPGGDGK